MWPNRRARSRSEGAQEGALDHQNLDLREPGVLAEDLRPGVGEVGEQRNAELLGDRLSGPPPFLQILHARAGQLRAQPLADPLDGTPQRLHPVGGREESEDEVPAELDRVTGADRLHLDVVRDAAFEAGADGEQFGDRLDQRARHVDRAAGHSVELSLACPRREAQDVVHVTVRDRDVLEGDERPRRTPGIESETQLRQQYQRRLPGPRTARQAQLPPGCLEAQLTHVRESAFRLALLSTRGGRGRLSGYGDRCAAGAAFGA